MCAIMETTPKTEILARVCEPHQRWKITHRSGGESQEGKEVKAMLYAPKAKGQGLVEYALIIALIAILLIVALSWVTGGLNSVFSRIAAYL